MEGQSSVLYCIEVNWQMTLSITYKCNLYLLLTRGHFDDWQLTLSISYSTVDQGTGRWLTVNYLTLSITYSTLNSWQLTLLGDRLTYWHFHHTIYCWLRERLTVDILFVEKWRPNHHFPIYKLPHTWHRNYIYTLIVELTQLKIGLLKLT